MLILPKHQFISHSILLWELISLFYPLNDTSYLAICVYICTSLSFMHVCDYIIMFVLLHACDTVLCFLHAVLYMIYSRL